MSHEAAGSLRTFSATFHDAMPALRTTLSFGRMLHPLLVSVPTICPCRACGRPRRPMLRPEPL
jgi:hypothetical protein